MKKITMYVMALILAVAVSSCTKEGPQGKTGLMEKMGVTVLTEKMVAPSLRAVVYPMLP
ncbi:hypothetical protein [Capnocytophaga canimorsus]|uniref:hypothetical protein n=1 Tax=Capnocytophaga canimorsus TaxID=28188 RepID=UPI001E3667EC|nr:hypothetical protein [Capnocytophaga canimorsus]